MRTTPHARIWRHQDSLRHLQFECLEARHLLSGANGSASNDGYATTGSGPLVVEAPGVLANDASSGVLSRLVELVTPPSHGILDLQEDGSFAYAPTSGFIEHTNRVETLKDRVALDREIFGSVDDLICDVSLLLPNRINR